MDEVITEILYRTEFIRRILDHRAEKTGDDRDCKIIVDLRAHGRDIQRFRPTRIVENGLTKMWVYGHNAPDRYYFLNA